jgi:hypothetical protein
MSYINKDVSNYFKLDYLIDCIYRYSLQKAGSGYADSLWKGDARMIAVKVALYL